MDTTNDLLQNPRQIISNPWRNRGSCTLKRLVFVLMITGLCGLLLTGCEGFWDSAADLFRLNSDDAEAQDQTRTRIEARAINTDSFRIVLDTDEAATPTFMIHDSTTEFTMQSTGTLTFNSTSGGNENIELEVGDILILTANGTNATVTIIRAD